MDTSLPSYLILLAKFGSCQYGVHWNPEEGRGREECRRKEMRITVVSLKGAPQGDFFFFFFFSPLWVFVKVQKMKPLHKCSWRHASRGYSHPWYLAKVSYPWRWVLYMKKDWKAFLLTLKPERQHKVAASLLCRKLSAKMKWLEARRPTPHSWHGEQRLLSAMGGHLAGRRCQPAMVLSNTECPPGMRTARDYENTQKLTPRQNICNLENKKRFNVSTVSKVIEKSPEECLGR